MKFLLASALGAALTLVTAHAAEAPAAAAAPSGVAQPAAVPKAEGPVATDKKEQPPKKSGTRKPAAPAPVRAPATAAPPAKNPDRGLEPASARDRPATQATPMMGTRGIARPATEATGTKPADPPPAPPK